MNLLGNLLLWLASHGVGVAGSSLWGAQFPPEGQGVMVQDTGGTATSYGRGDHLRTFFIACRNTSLQAAEAKAWEIYSLLDRAGKLQMGSGATADNIFDAHAIQPPFQMGGQDDRQMWLWVANYQITVRRR